MTNTTSERLRSKRLSMGLSARALSKMAGLSHSLVGKIERGERVSFNTETAMKLAWALDVSVGWLLHGTDDGLSVRGILAAPVSNANSGFCLTKASVEPLATPKVVNR